MRIIGFITFLGLSISAAALTIDGRVSIKKSQIFLNDNYDEKTYILEGSSETVKTFLKRLKNGDFVSIEGTKNEDWSKVSVATINYVGLKDLLGIWIGDDSYCYNFNSFTEFTILSHVNGRKCTNPTPSPIYTYLASPTLNSWVLLISGQRTSYVGDLKFIGPNSIQIQLFDSETGDILRTLNLRK